MPASANNAIEVSRLTKQFGGKKVVDNLTFNVPQGTITGFIGPNGAGKTTTLRMLATLLKPDYGTINIFGHSVSLYSKKVRHNIGYMPDYFGVYENMEVEEYLDFFAATYHISLYKREPLIKDILNLIDLSEKRGALVNELSRGMQQRLSLGRSLIHDPKLLLLDEPASGLDPRARIELIALFRELRKMGKTIFVSSHILAELRDLCDFVVIIEKGKLVYNGTITDAIASISKERAKLRVVLSERIEEAASVLKNAKGIFQTETGEGGVILIDYDPAAVSTSQIIKWLVTNDYMIQEVAKESAKLEDVFMTLTEGGVS